MTQKLTEDFNESKSLFIEEAITTDLVVVFFREFEY